MSFDNLNGVLVNINLIVLFWLYKTDLAVRVHHLST